MSSYAQIWPQGAEKQLSKVRVVDGGGGGGWVYRANANTALVQMEQSLQELVNLNIGYKKQTHYMISSSQWQGRSIWSDWKPSLRPWQPRWFSPWRGGTVCPAPWSTGSRLPRCLDFLWNRFFTSYSSFVSRIKLNPFFKALFQSILFLNWLRSAS